MSQTTDANARMQRPLDVVDAPIADLLREEAKRQATGLELIPSENLVSEAVLEAMGSIFTNKYAEGYPGKRYYGGCEFADGIEQLAIDRAKQLFGAEHANVQAHSGTSANVDGGGGTTRCFSIMTWRAAPSIGSRPVSAS